jgi:hypothetical protein
MLRLAESVRGPIYKIDVKGETMFRMKHLVVAAVLLLTVAGASAVHFRSADAVYIPVAGHIGGGASALFISDLFLQNPNNEAIDVSYAFIPTGATPTRQNIPGTVRLQANERKEVRDFMTAPTSAGGLGLSGSPLGAVIIFGCRAGGNCTDPDPNSGVDPDFRNLIAFSRIFSVPGSFTANPFDGPSTGQAFPGLPWYSVASMNAGTGGVGTAAELNRVFITGVRATGSGQGTYRTNLNLMNASSFSTTVLVARLFRGESPSAQIGEARFTIGPLGNFQQNIAGVFGITPGPTMTNLFITVEQESSTATNDADPGCAANGGCPGFFALATALDNGSGDATTLEGTYSATLNQAALDALYGTKAGGASAVRRSVKRP